MATIFSNWKEGLERTRKATFGKIATLFGATEISHDTWDELEGLLIQSDMGMETTAEVLKSLKQQVNNKGITRSIDLQQLLREELISRLDQVPEVSFPQNSLSIILLIGVNGSGKTTSAAKLAYYFTRQGQKVLLAAADTYRAAAVDQLEVWAERLRIPIISGQPGSDPGAVVFDSIQSAVARNMNILLIDTAGRLHTRYNLMEELKKVHRVSQKAFQGAPHAVWLVLDATTGQNALQQARAFKEAVHVTGIILAKLDSSARGGMAFAIQNQLGLPIIFAGLGEKPEDFEIFDRVEFVDGILAVK